MPASVLDRVFYLLIKAHRDRSAALGRDIERLGAVAASDSTNREGRSIRSNS